MVADTSHTPTNVPAKPTCPRAPSPRRSVRLPRRDTRKPKASRGSAKAITPSPVPPHSLHAVPLVPSALNTHCRTESVASARDRNVSRKLFPGKGTFNSDKTFRQTPKERWIFARPPSLSSLAYAPEPARPPRHKAEGQRDEPPNR